jgi:pimeloyl-ACP methyl ester carboxylesterase
MDVFVLQNEENINGYELEFDIYRKDLNPPNVLLLCQGYSLSKDYWSLEFIENILANTNINTIVCYNYRGFTSKKIPTNNLINVPSNKLKLSLLAKDLTEFILYLNQKYWQNKYTISLLGHSMGTFILHEFMNHLSEYRMLEKHISSFILVSGGCHCSFDFIEKFNNRNWELFVQQSANSNSKKYVTFTNLLLYASMIFINRLKNPCDFKKTISPLNIPLLNIRGEDDTFLTYRKNDDCIENVWRKNRLKNIVLPKADHHLFNKNLKELTQIIIVFLCEIE